MSRHAIFLQECPVCGRPLEIRREYQGKKVACPHCGGWFTAIDALRNPRISGTKTTACFTGPINCWNNAWPAVLQ